MSQHCTIDFETRSRADLTKTGAYRYAEDESTRVLWMAYNLTGDDLDTILWHPDEEFPEELREHIEAGKLVEAHHSFFEHCIWNLVCVPNLDFPPMPLKQWRCSMAKCRANGIPGSLDAAGTALDLDIKKDKIGKSLIQKLCKPRRITKKNTEEWNNDPILMKQLGDYCVTDVDTEIVLSDYLADMTETEIEIWLLDQLINWRGIYIDINAVEQTIKVLEQTATKYENRLKELSGGRFTTSGQRAKILDWCDDQGFSLPGYTKDDIEKALAKPKIPDNVKEVLQIRQILGKSSTAKYQAMINKIAEDGRVHEVLVYHKAHTGRWGGAGIQIQNLPRPIIKDDPEFIVDVLNSGSLDDVEVWYDNPLILASSAIRSMIIPPPGKKFVSADYAAIEARVLFWLAEDESAMDIFRRGECIYSDMASGIYNTPYQKIWSGYKKEIAEYEMMRFMGKQAILGLGYQMGAPKFVASCDGFGVTIEESFSKQVVTTYRKKFSSVVKLWYGLEEAACKAMENPGCAFTYKKIKYKFDGKYYLLCKLPSGRTLKYPGASYKMAKTAWGDMKMTLHYMTYSDGRWKETTTYGGKLTENVDQAVSRDIMAEALLRLESNDYPVLMSVHDEAISEVDKDFGNVKEYCDIMCVLPDWAKGLPLKAEGWEGQRYRK